MEPLIGKGLFNKHHSIAYVEIKIYQSKQEDYLRNRVIWNISDEQISNVQPTYKTDIETSLIFFLRYISALRGEVIKLTFEINDATYDETSTRWNPFINATLYALINSFDPEILSSRDETVEILKNNIERKFR